MGYSLPAGVVNTDSAYFYPDATMALGPLVKQLADQTLVLVDYSVIGGSLSISSYRFTIDVSSNPALVVSYPQLDATRAVLSFLVSGGIAGQQYNVSIHISTNTAYARTDVLTVNVPSSGDCACEIINPVPALYTQIPLGEPTQGYVNSAVRYFWGNTPPSNPSVMDQWYDVTTSSLYEWATDGTSYFWQLMMSVNLVSDAPLDNTNYVRYNGYWVADPIQNDAPQTGLNYSRGYGGWVADPIQSDAPNDGYMYVRQANSWTLLPEEPILSDAPSDGNTYGRLNATWTIIPPQVILIDAPADGNAYMRTNSAWANGGTLTGALRVVGNLETDGSMFVGVNMFVGGVTTFGAQVSLPYDPIQPLQAATKEYVDNSIANAFVLNGSPFLRLAGGTMTGAIELAADPVNLMEPVTLQYFNDHSAAGLTDAVADGTAYGRMNHTWVNVLPLTGGTLTGPLILQADPTTALGAATKQYVDATVSADVPQPSGSPPPMDGIAATGMSLAYARADHVHPTDTSLYPVSNPQGYQTAAQVAASLANYYPVSNPQGYQTAAQVAASLANYYPVSNPAGYQTAAQVTASLAPYALTSSVPLASSISPIMDGTAAVGSATTWARGDHVHPTDTSRYAASNPAGYQTAAQVAAVTGNYLPLTGGTLTGPLILAADPTTLLGAATKQYVDNLVIDAGTF